MKTEYLIILAIVVFLLLRETSEALPPSEEEPLPDEFEGVDVAQLRKDLSVIRGRLSRYSSLIQRYARANDLDPHLVEAIIWLESSARPDVSRREDGHRSYGLMGVTPGAAQDVGFRGRDEALYDVETNIKYGTAYLKHLIDKFPKVKFSVPIALGIIAYNVGASRIKKTEDGRYTYPKAGRLYFNRVRARWLLLQ